MMSEKVSATIRAVARIHTDFPGKFGLPRQSGVVPGLKGVVEIDPEFYSPEALRGIESFSHIWLIWGFSENAGAGWSPTVRPPRLGGNVRRGVFATRSPYRPNGLGMSCVKLESVEKNLLHVSGIDMVDGTPIYDIKPYVPFSDCRPEASQGFSTPVSEHQLEVDIPEEFAGIVPEGKLEQLKGILKNDPRPAYQEDPSREYCFEFAGMRICFTVDRNVLTVGNLVRL